MCFADGPAVAKNLACGNQLKRCAGRIPVMLWRGSDEHPLSARASAHKFGDSVSVSVVGLIHIGLANAISTTRRSLRSLRAVPLPRYASAGEDKRALHIS
jgi:hypothetical protein